MARRLRLQYAGAIYHLMARGNGRQEIVRDDADREWLQEDLGKAAIRCSWRVYAYVIMPNHLHIVLEAPELNLARGMQTFLSVYANVWARRHKFSGHVFPGEKSHFGDECRARGGAGVVASGKRAEPDPPFP